MSTKLPESVTKLLNSTRYVHLATCLDNIPHVSLMNYTYYHGNEDYIIMTTPKGTTKYENMVANPNVSLLLHDWMAAKTTSEDTSEATGKRRNSLYEFLTNLNKTEISRVSVMINGRAEELSVDAEKHNFFKSLHLNNSSIDEVQAENYIKDGNTALFIIKIDLCKVTDTENNVEEY
ncbi:DEHA2E10208p [Debaryomyces hansenii CBS767]|uniref:DEHA2E10208p n=1 Tax=Debaryomyces hansenii (strain ATCC 36239 / CBS 767 / BCRC 21394 / JCM 1990 / NBRC 0083 / IGC 2968) TaxID=284592 RepID=Q6BPX1_DEBHA|nr:DEHA2E10208p [Debaryomyces hansenii CBS767]CAG87987.1 DEHA2E10208p [Debaryomyces hansenii CBS767]|eukprot:XP_459749.1 DEHA2E10208p [Debaryomyces hansenii CBS767]